MAIREVNPPDGIIGSPDILVRIIGDAFKGATGVSFGQGIEIVRYTVIEDGLIAAVVRVLDDATPGFKDVEVFLPGNVTHRLHKGFLVA